MNLEITQIPFDHATVSGQPNPNQVYNYPPNVNILHWDYNWPSAEIYSFEIYRSVDSTPFRIYDVVHVHKQTHQYPPQLAQYIQPGRNYYIDLQMLAKHNGVYGSGSGGASQGGSGGTSGGQGGQNNPNGNGGPYPPKKYDYRVIAHHKDGSTSSMSLPSGTFVN